MISFRLNWFMPFAAVLMMSIPIASHYDALLFIGPDTRQYVTVEAVPDEAGRVGYWEIFQATLKLNLWEIMLWLFGAVTGIATWGRPIRWKGREVWVRI